jgi:phage shock protein E
VHKSTCRRSQALGIVDTMKLLQTLRGFFVLIVLGGYVPATLAAENPVWWERAEIVARQEGYRLVTQKQLQTLYGSQKNFLIVDVRPDYEFKDGHLPRAVQIEFSPADRYSLKPDKRSRFESVLGSDKNRRIIIYCLNYN